MGIQWTRTSILAFEVIDMSKRILVISGLSLLIAGAAWGQEAPTAPQTPPSTPDTQKNRVPTTNRQTEPRRMEQTVFLSGKVVVDDGSPLPESVGVELICNGSIKTRVYTTSKGDFSITLGGNRAASAFEADIGGPGLIGSASSQTSTMPTSDRTSGFFSDPGRVDLSSCELRARLAGFQSNTLALGFRRALDNPDVGTILLHRLANVQGTTISYNTLAAPEKARKAFEKARKELEKKEPNHTKATQELEFAVKEYPAFAGAWTLLGKERITMKDKSGAAEAFEKSIATDPKYVEPYLYLAMLRVDEGRWPDAARITEQIEQLNPFISHAHYLNAVANYQLGLLDRAEKSLLEVRKSADAARYPLVHYMLGGILANRGEYDSAGSEFRQYLEAKSDPALKDKLTKVLEDWEQRGLIKKMSAPKEK